MLAEADSSRALAHPWSSDHSITKTNQRAKVCVRGHIPRARHEGIIPGHWNLCLTPGRPHPATRFVLKPGDLPSLDSLDETAQAMQSLQALFPAALRPSALFSILLGVLAAALPVKLSGATLPSGFTEANLTGTLASPTAMAIAP